MSQELRTEVVCGIASVGGAELKIYGSDFGFFMSHYVTIGAGMCRFFLSMQRQHLC